MFVDHRETAERKKAGKLGRTPIRADHSLWPVVLNYYKDKTCYGSRAGKDYICPHFQELIDNAARAGYSIKLFDD